MDNVFENGRRQVEGCVAHLRKEVDAENDMRGWERRHDRLAEPITQIAAAEELWKEFVEDERSSIKQYLSAYEAAVRPLEAIAWDIHGCGSLDRPRERRLLKERDKLQGEADAAMERPTVAFMQRTSTAFIGCLLQIAIICDPASYGCSSYADRKAAFERLLSAARVARERQV